jgi:hypothetical protein
MQGRAEFEQEASGLSLANLSPPNLFSSSTAILGSVFFFSLSFHPKHQKNSTFSILSLENLEHK